MAWPPIASEANATCRCASPEKPAMSTNLSEEMPVWVPSAHAIERARIGEFMRWLERERGVVLPGYEQLWAWSVEQVDAFWSALWDWAEIRSDVPRGVALADARM